MKAERNKTIDFLPEDAPEYLARCLRVTEDVPLDTVCGRTICGDTFAVAPHLPRGFADLLIVDPPYNLTKDFSGGGFRARLKQAAADAQQGRASIFGYYVNDPERFGIVEFDENGKVISVEEKPQHPKSNYAITGLYFYNKEVVQMAKQVKPSARGELEITTLNDMYLKKDELDVQLLGRGFAWLDTGTMDSLVEAADFVRMIEKRQGIKISAPEEIAFKYGWIDRDTLLESAERYGKSPYGQHLKNVADGKLRY